MAILGWIFTSMFLWTLEKNRSARDVTGQASDAPLSPYQRILGLEQGQWDSLDLSQQREYLEKRIEGFEALPAQDAKRRQLLPELYYWMATVATRMGDGDRAFAQLERAGIVPGAEDWYHMLRGAAFEARQQRQEALDAYLTSFSYELIPVVWSKLNQFSLSPAELIRRTREKLFERSRPFPDFDLQTPSGQPRRLADYKGRVVLVNFFFPG